MLLRLDGQGRCAIDPHVAIASLRARFPTVMPDPTVLDSALRVSRDHQQFWDAVILASCAAAGVEQFFTEDMPSGARILGVEIASPFVNP